MILRVSVLQMKKRTKESAQSEKPKIRRLDFCVLRQKNNTISVKMVEFNVNCAFDSKLKKYKIGIRA